MSAEMDLDYEDDDDESDICPMCEGEPGPQGPCSLCGGTGLKSVIEPPVIIVVSGIITAHDGRLLLTQRTAKQDFPFTWESAGGKLTLEEDRQFRAAQDLVLDCHRRVISDAQAEVLVVALHRELREELGIDLSLTQREPIASIAFETAGAKKPLMLYFLHVREYQGRPVPREGQGMGLFNRREFDALSKSASLTPGNAMAYDAIVRATFDVMDAAKRTA